jgi:hypothetical protein
MKKIQARFNSQCAETGKRIKKGDTMYYDYSAKKCYCLESNKAKQQDTPANPDLAGFIQAEQDAYFDNFCQQNNI